MPAIIHSSCDLTVGSRGLAIAAQAFKIVGQTLDSTPFEGGAGAATVEIAAKEVKYAACNIGGSPRAFLRV